MVFTQMTSTQMKEKRYYWESKTDSGLFYASSDEEAKTKAANIENLELLYTAFYHRYKVIEIKEILNNVRR